MGVFSDGSTYLTGRGLAKMCGMNMLRSGRPAASFHAADGQTEKPKGRLDERAGANAQSVGHGREAFLGV
jgi:hypothetical protein